MFKVRGLQGCLAANTHPPRDASVTPQSTDSMWGRMKTMEALSHCQGNACGASPTRDSKSLETPWPLRGHSQQAAPLVPNTLTTSPTPTVTQPCSAPLRLGFLAAARTLLALATWKHPGWELSAPRDSSGYSAAGLPLPRHPQPLLSPLPPAPPPSARSGSSTENEPLSSLLRKSPPGKAKKTPLTASLNYNEP